MSESRLTELKAGWQKLTGKAHSHKTAITVAFPKHIRKKPVVCVDTGNRFESAKDAVAWLNSISDHTYQSNAVNNAIRNGSKCGGKRFKYVEED